MRAPLLVELLTEELPPKPLQLLADAFGHGILNGLARYQLKSRDLSGVHIFATPRRLAVLIPDVLERAEDRLTEVAGPSVRVALDGTGKPTAALAGFAKKNGVAVETLEQRDTAKGKVFVARVTIAGQTLAGVLSDVVGETLKALPIPKMMRWGDGDAEFVRPVHGLVMLHGAHVIPGTVLGLTATNRTRGHRFMGAERIVVRSPETYERQLRDEGVVIASFAERRGEIDRLLREEATRSQAQLGSYDALLDEVTALVEHPSVYVGEFDPAFLAIPPECLILTMRQNQKYFPLFDATGRLLPRFLIVSNMRVDDPGPIVSGNQRVVRPRLEDARFFYDQDRKMRLEARVPELAKVVYHNKLGNQLERVERIQLLGGRIARMLQADVLLTERAAWLCKADLLTGMVGEFPELQGIMGRYYALQDGEPDIVADAIEAHYHPRFSGDRLPQSPVAAAVGLADKLDTLAGLFGVGQQPSGERDPFGLRRAALGVLRIIVELTLPLSLHDLVKAAFEGYHGHIGDAHADLEIFIYERFAGYLKERGYTAHEVDAVLSMNPDRLDFVLRQLNAVRAFAALPEAESLAAANKRVVNILRQAQTRGESFIDAESGRLVEPAERTLFDALHATSREARRLFDAGDFTGYLKSFAVLKLPVDAFFDSVMVMVDDPALRRNRLALLADLRAEMNRVADISKLAA